MLNDVLVITVLNLLRWTDYESQEWFCGETLIPVPHLHGGKK